MGKMNIQLFEDVEPETSNEEEVTEEVTDEVTEDTETKPVDNTEEPEKVEKSFTQEEVEDILKKRLGRESKKIARDYESKLSKYKELEYLTTKGLKAESLDDVLSKSREFYGKQGIKYEPDRSEREIEILANADAEEILDSCDNTDDIEAEVKRILAKGSSMTNRDKAIAKRLTNELETNVRINSLKEIGVSEKVYNSNDFKNFEKRFTKETPIKEIYEMYRSIKKPTKQVENPGSMKTTIVKENKGYITEAEYDKMSRAEVKANLDLIEKSMPKW